MSGKIKAKDLSYDKSLPPFLQRLHAQHAGRPDADRHEQPIPRARKQKEHSDEDDPTVVDESGETITKEQLAEMSSATRPQDTNAEAGPNDPSDASNANTSGRAAGEREAGKITEGLTRKKRKFAKVVGDDAVIDSAVDQKKKTGTKSKKLKAIKLAFDDND